MELDQLYYVAHKQSICQSTNFLNASSNIRSVKSVSTLNFQINEPKNNMTFRKEREMQCNWFPFGVQEQMMQKIAKLVLKAIFRTITSLPSSIFKFMYTFNSLFRNKRFMFAINVLWIVKTASKFGINPNNFFCIFIKLWKFTYYSLKEYLLKSLYSLGMCKLRCNFAEMESIALTL